MAACDSLHHMFDAQLGCPSPSIPRTSSVTELFGELHFEESPALTSDTDASFDMMAKGDERKAENKGEYIGIGTRHRSGGSLQLCTEGLGFESLGDVEDANEDERGGTMTTAKGEERRNGDGDEGGGYYCFWAGRRRGSGPMLRRWRSTVVTKTERVVGGSRGCFPPPISIVNRPWVSLRGYRCDGRFMLKEVTVPAREFLHASREGGRLRLDFVLNANYDDDEEDGVDKDGDEDGDEEEEDENDEGGIIHC